MIELRRYRTDDHDAVWHLHNAALKHAGAHAGNGAWDDDLHRIEKVYLEDRGEFLVGEADGRIVAMGALKRTTDDRAEIKRMRVYPEHQRRGYGQAVLSALEQRARELGYKVLHLDTTTLQTAAQGLYVKNGFEQVGRRTLGEYTVLLFEKALI